MWEVVSLNIGRVETNDLLNVCLSLAKPCGQVQARPGLLSIRILLLRRILNLLVAKIKCALIEVGALDAVVESVERRLSMWKVENSNE